MAISQNPLTGKMSGTVGNFVTSTHRGQNIVRSKAFNPKDANSEAQQKHRNLFRMLSEEYVSLASVVKNGFPARPRVQTPYNAFMAINIPNAVDKSGSVPVIDYSKMVISKGSLVRVNLLGAELSVEGVTIRYQPQSHIPGASEDDEVVAVLKTQEGAVYVASKLRGSAEADEFLIAFPDASAERVLYAYLLVLSADRNSVSQSVYVSVT
ncbi:MAG: hypothetical protein GX361_03260 [Bacteroidales bacterium]|nr:hypothetical protein [Bacteroidales bacterium]